MPRLFAVLEIKSQELVFTSTKYSAASLFFRSVPDRLRDFFCIVRYDANDSWIPTEEEKND